MQQVGSFSQPYQDTWNTITVWIWLLVCLDLGHTTVQRLFSQFRVIQASKISISATLLSLLFFRKSFFCAKFLEVSVCFNSYPPLVILVFILRIPLNSNSHRHHQLLQRLPSLEIMDGVSFLRAWLALFPHTVTHQNCNLTTNTSVITQLALRPRIFVAAGEYLQCVAKLPKQHRLHELPQKRTYSDRVFVFDCSSLSESAQSSYADFSYVKQCTCSVFSLQADVGKSWHTCMNIK